MSAGPPWHALATVEAVARLEADARTGLTRAQAAERLLRFGANRLASAKPRPVWLKFLDRFRNVLTLF